MANARLLAILPLALLAAGTAPAPAPPVGPPPADPLPAEQATFRAHVQFLADDALRGREAGSPEYDIAAAYVAAQFAAAGLAPAGDVRPGGGRSFVQAVPLIGYKPADKGDFVVTAADGAPVPLHFGRDYVPYPDPGAAATTRSGRLVYVREGLVAPRWGRDDYRGADVRGRIVAFTGGATGVTDPEERAHFARLETKARAAAARGAIGFVLIEPGDFARTARGYARQRVTWAGKDGFAPPAGAPQLGSLSAAAAARLFGDRWMTARSPVASRATLTAATRTEFVKLPSGNVVGRLAGGDPRLADEHVVLSAHLDHVGTCPEVAGDAICNGAMDNATGVAALIEEARRFQAAPTRPRRSILFVALTAEEKGLVGADYFARHPPVPIGRVVANVNLDMPLLTYAFEDMTVYGANRSTLGPVVVAAAGAVGVPMTRDPAPEMGLFVRSDHYRFVQQGVPSVFLWPGQAGPGKAAWTTFFATHYHRPSDDLNQPIDWAQAVRFVGVNYAIARAVADADARPVWNRGDFFGTLYRGPMAR